MKPAQLVLLLFMNLCWALVFSAYKLVGAQLSTGSIVTLRFGLAGFALLMCWPWLPGPAPRGRDLLVTCMMGLMLFVIGQRLQVYGNHLGTAANSSVLIGLEPLITSIGAAIFLGEHIGPRRLAGFGIAIGGIAILNGVWRSDFHWANLAASLLIVASFMAEAAYTVVGKLVSARASIMKMITISLLAGTAGNLLIDGRGSFAATQTLGAQAWGLLIVMGLVCTSFGYCVWFLVIRDCPVSVAALTIFAQSVFGVIIAAAWLGEALHWRQAFGSLTIVAALILGLYRQVRSVSEKSAPPAQ